MRKLRKKSWLFVGTMMVFMLVLAACGKQESVQPQPVDEAVDTCAKCHMAVKNNGYAAQYVTEDGKSVKFDDIGCLHKHTAAHTEEKIADMFVQDSGTKDWVSLKDASYVYAMDVPTPMGYGIHAFKDKADAETFVKEKGVGELLAYDQLQKHEWKMDKSKMMPHEGMKHGEMKEGEHKQ
ncbi:nitrous oxide reductase accessory protein NosL [Aneurinibacillus sp. REN35]|uniref:nitrous oxide reductase accessory protein NosL n=1 Tax=Aneurinibacillus sp. REN35 TaxID=3237286 RepID=UPI0035287BDB